MIIVTLFFFHSSSPSVDPLELKKNSRSATFYYRDANAFVNCKRIFLDISWIATRHDGTELTQSDNVSCLNPAAHNLIQAVTINIGMRVSLISLIIILFLDAPTRPYKRACPSVRHAFVESQTSASELAIWPCFSKDNIRLFFFILHKANAPSTKTGLTVWYRS